MHHPPRPFASLHVSISFTHHSQVGPLGVTVENKAPSVLNRATGDPWTVRASRVVLCHREVGVGCLSVQLQRSVSVGALFLLAVAWDTTAPPLVPCCIRVTSVRNERGVADHSLRISNSIVSSLHLLRLPQHISNLTHNVLQSFTLSRTTALNPLLTWVVFPLIIQYRPGSRRVQQSSHDDLLNHSNHCSNALASARHARWCCSLVHATNLAGVSKQSNHSNTHSIKVLYICMIFSAWQ